MSGINTVQEATDTTTSEAQHNSLWSLELIPSSSKGFFFSFPVRSSVLTAPLEMRRAVRELEIREQEREEMKVKPNPFSISGCVSTVAINAGRDGKRAWGRGVRDWEMCVLAGTLGWSGVCVYHLNHGGTDPRRPRLAPYCSMSLITFIPPFLSHFWATSVPLIRPSVGMIYLSGLTLYSNTSLNISVLLFFFLLKDYLSYFFMLCALKIIDYWIVQWQDWRIVFFRDNTKIISNAHSWGQSSIKLGSLVYKMHDKTLQQETKQQGINNQTNQEPDREQLYTIR